MTSFITLGILATSSVMGRSSELHCNSQHHLPNYLVCHRHESETRNFALRIPASAPKLEFDRIIGTEQRSSLSRMASMNSMVSNFQGPIQPLDQQKDEQKTQTEKPKTKEEIKREQEQRKFEQELANDKKMGKEASDYYDRQYAPTKDAKAQQRVEEIGERLSLVANANEFPVLWGDKRKSEFEYKFRVVEEKDINAFSLPGGYIYVFQGLVDFVQSDEELAGVLAHEICHASQRHVATLQREQSKVASFQIPLILASIFTGGAAAVATTATASNLVGTAVTNGWSVKAETSADAGAYELMVAAGYDPTGLLTFMERLQAQQSMIERVLDLGIFRTHPPSKVRADRIEGLMRKDSLAIRRSKVTIDFRVISKEEEGKHSLYFGKRRLFIVGGENAQERSKELSKKLNEFLDSVPELFEVTIGENGVIFGRSKTLFRLTEEDVSANAVPMDRLQNDVAKAIRTSIYSLAYHIWEGRGG